MRILQSIEELKSFQQGVFVPTMGAMHEGHLALIRRAKEIARSNRPTSRDRVVARDVPSPPPSPTGRWSEAPSPPAPLLSMASLRPGGEGVCRVIVSIFVNPKQFNDPNDLERYPRDLDRDVSLASQAGAEIIFAPSVEVIYPPDIEIPVPPLPDVATKPGLEDHFRPGHLSGVCQVVARLFDLIQPRFAIFGEKDYQQLKVIEAMVVRENQVPSSPRWVNLQIIAHETVRESAGLAMSSRNVQLPPNMRSRALGLFHALREAHQFTAPGRDVRRVEELMRSILVRHQVDELEYAVVRDAQTLMPIEQLGEAGCNRALIAARVAGVRLIDNMSM